MKLPQHASGFRRRKIKQSIGDIEEEKPEGTTSVSIALFSSRMLRQSASGILDTSEAYLVKRCSFPDSDVSRTTDGILRRLRIVHNNKEGIGWPDVLIGAPVPGLEIPFL